MEKRILIYGFRDEDRLNRIREICGELGIKIIEAKETDLNEKLGYLVGLEGYESVNQPSSTVFDTEYMNLAFFDNESLNSFLIRLREENLVVPHKSALTDTTKDWTLGYLIDHIMEEHRFMMLFNSAKKLLEYSKGLGREDIGDEIKSLEALLSTSRMTEDELKDEYEKLRRAIENPQ